MLQLIWQLLAAAVARELRIGLQAHMQTAPLVAAQVVQALGLFMVARAARQAPVVPVVRGGGEMSMAGQQDLNSPEA